MKRLKILFALALPVSLYSQTTKLPVVITPKFKKDTLSITKYGAVADGNTLNTKSINAAIVALSKKGGGVVLIPAGLWLTGPVVLKNNINPLRKISARVRFSSISQNLAIYFTMFCNVCCEATD